MRGMILLSIMPLISTCVLCVCVGPISVEECSIVQRSHLLLKGILAVSRFLFFLKLTFSLAYKEMAFIVPFSCIHLKSCLVLICHLVLLCLCSILLAGPFLFPVSAPAFITQTALLFPVFLPLPDTSSSPLNDTFPFSCHRYAHTHNSD